MKQTNRQTEYICLQVVSCPEDSILGIQTMFHTSNAQWYKLGRDTVNVIQNLKQTEHQKTQ